MSLWLTVTAQLVPRHVDLEAARYQRTAHELAIQVNDAVARAVTGPAWLKQRFPANSAVNIELNVHAGDQVEVGKPRTKNYGGPKEITCKADLPAGWFAEPGDGLLGIRFLRAVMQALTAIGENYELGSPPIRAAQADTGKPALIDLFTPRPIEPSNFQHADDSISRLVDEMGPTELILAAVEPADPDIRGNRLAVAKSLGLVQSEQVFPAGEEQVRVWTIRRSS